MKNCSADSTTIPIYKYGFTGDWRKEPIWK